MHKNEVRKPDVKGPRFRNKRISILTRKTLEEFIKKYPEYSDLSLKEFKEIIMTFNAELVQGIIDNRDGIELPDGLGFIFMASCPPAKKKNVDYKKSHQYGVSTTYKNWDSDNKLLKIFYTNHNTKYPFANKQVWSFKASKTFRKKASEAYKEDWAKYAMVSPTEKISARFDKYRKQDYKRNLKPIIPEGYDEFKM
jgi:hypothetical protein